MDKKKIGIVVGVILLAIIIVVLVLFSSKNDVTFNTNGGSDVTSQTIKFFKKANKPATPTREGYTFDNWYYDGEVFDFDTKITKDMVIEARWIANDEGNDEDTYTITFNTGAGSKVSSQKVEKDGKIKKPTNPTRDGYEFVAWEYEGEEWDFNDKVKENMTLTAKWKKADSTTADTTFKISSGNISLTVNKSRKLSTKNADGSVTWSSSNTKVATVDKNGNVKAVGVGTAKITAKDSSGKTSTITVTVKAASTGNQGGNTGTTTPSGGNQGGNTGTTPEPPEDEKPPVDEKPDLSKYKVSCDKINETQCAITIRDPQGNVVSGTASITVSGGGSGTKNSGDTLLNGLFQSGTVTALN